MAGRNFYSLYRGSQIMQVEESRLKIVRYIDVLSGIFYIGKLPYNGLQQRTSKKTPL